MRAAAVFCKSDAHEIAWVLEDAGFEIRGKLSSGGGDLVILISGDELPAQCEGLGLVYPERLLAVDITLERQFYGRQSILKVAEIRPNGRTFVDCVRRLLDT